MLGPSERLIFRPAFGASLAASDERLASSTGLQMEDPASPLKKSGL